MKRALATLFMSLGLVVALPASAQAVEILFDKNTYGEYDCQVSISRDHQYLTKGCNIFDHECDGYGVYVGMAIRLEGQTRSGAYSRVTPNAGGCGNARYFTRKSRYNSPPGNLQILEVYTRLCVDVPQGKDYCYSGTQDSHHFGYA